MKRVYTTPEMEIVRFSLKDVIMGSPLESSIPDQGATMPPEIDSELPDL